MEQKEVITLLRHLTHREVERDEEKFVDEFGDDLEKLDDTETITRLVDVLGLQPFFDEIDFDVETLTTTTPLEKQMNEWKNIIRERN